MEEEGGGPRGKAPAGPWPVQLRYQSGLTGEPYVKGDAWSDARLWRCPDHPRGGCSFARHGTYPRKTPRGVRIARWYCPDSHMTFSLLPDCLAARLPGTLQGLEDVVAVAEAAPSLAAAADAVRRDAVLLPGAMRWVRRRVARVHRALTAVRGLCPERFVHCAAEVGALRTRLGTTAVLVHLRELGAEQLPALPAPVGFFPRAQTSGNRVRGFQHRVGPDPPVPGV